MMVCGHGIVLVEMEENSSVAVAMHPENLADRWFGRENCYLKFSDLKSGEIKCPLGLDWENMFSDFDVPNRPAGESRTLLAGYTTGPASRKKLISGEGMG